MDFKVTLMKKKSQITLQNPKAAGLIFDSSIHYLDHLAPFCAILKWPLIITEPQIQELAKRFYPGLEIIESSVMDIRKTLQPFSHLVTCAPRPLITASLGPISWRRPPARRGQQWDSRGWCSSTAPRPHLRSSIHAKS